MHFDLSQYEFQNVSCEFDKLAVVGEDQNLTWGELHESAMKIAEIMQAVPRVGKSQPRVVLFGHKSAFLIAAVAGAMQIGWAYTPVDSIFTPLGRLNEIVEILQPELVVDLSGQATEDVLAHISQPVCYVTRQKNAWSSTRVLEGSSKPPVELAEKLAYTLFTSGSTGAPKGVLVSREALTEFVMWLARDFGFSNRDIFFNQAPLNFDLSVYELASFLHFGATLVLSTAHASAEQVIELVRQHRCSVWVSTPSFVMRFLREDGFVQDDLVSLRKFVFCGEVLPLQTARNLAKKFCLAEIINSYGPTEGTVACTRIVISKSLLDSDGPLPVGYPMRTSAVGLLRESGNIDFSPDAEAGEIVIFGPNVAHGYLGDCVTSADKFFTHCGQRAFRTGDVGYMKDGVLHFSGRKEGFVKLNGFRIELDEIARRMECINGVAQACAFPILRDGEVRRIVAVYTRDESRKQCVENVEISLALRESLPTYMVPSEVIAVDAMPLTRNGKVDVGALRAVVSGITRRT